MPSTMRAAVLTAPGIENLHVTDLPVPEPAAGQVRIKVMSFGLNRSEYHSVTGRAEGMSYPRVLGIEASGVVDLAGAVAELSNLRLVGLMLIGANTDDVAAVAASHARVRELRDAVRAAGVASCTELSMGMTGDMEIAIAEGSTEVRVGTAVFGPRPVMKHARSS